MISPRIRLIINAGEYTIRYAPTITRGTEPIHNNIVIFQSIHCLNTTIRLMLFAIKKMVIIAIAVFIGNRNDEKGIRINALPNPKVEEKTEAIKANIKNNISSSILMD